MWCEIFPVLVACAGIVLFLNVLPFYLAVFLGILLALWAARHRC